MNRITLLRLIVIIGFVAAVELLCRTGVISPMTMIPPSAMLAALVHIVLKGEADADLLFTLTNIAAAITLSVVAGFIVGAIIHALPRLRRVIDPYLAAYYAVPTFVFYPLLIVVFGINRLPLIIIGAMFGTVGMTVSTIDGIERIPQVLLKTARACRMNPIKTAVMIKLPAAAPHLFTGVKLAVTYSVIGIVAGEFILSIAGLGRRIAFAYNDLDNTKMYALLLLLLTITSLINVALQLIEQRLYRRWGSA